MSPVTTVEMECISEGGTLSLKAFNVPYSGNWEQMDRDFEAGIGASLDAMEWAISEAALNSTAAALRTMAFSDDCVKSINSVMSLRTSDNGTVSELRDAARKVTFKNGVTTTDAVYGQRISGIFAADANRYAASPTPGTAIYWRPGAEVGRAAGWLGGAVIHELLHNVGFTDEDMHIGLRLDKLPGYNSGFTDDISRRFGTDCFGMK